MDLVDALLRRTRLPPDAPAVARLGARMAAQYHRWGEAPDLERLIDGLWPRTGLAAAAPLARTAHAVGDALMRWGGQPYHSIGHHAEVATNAMLLAALGPPLPPHSLGLLLCAALAHDLSFNPWQQAAGRFAAEQRSAAALDALAATQGVPAADRAALRLLVLATEPLARAGLRALLRDGAAHPDAALAELAARPELLALAALLSDADLLSAAGLSERWQRVTQARLAREWQRTVTQADQRWFFDAIHGPDYLSAGGALFLPNLRRIRAATLPPTLANP